MSFSLSSVSPSRITEAGGHEITITGVFEIGHRYLAYIGDVGGTADHPCPSGVAGQGYYLYLQSATSLKCYSPALPPNKTLTLTVKDGDSAEAHSLADSITIDYRQYYTAVFKSRKILPNFYETGPRDIEQIGAVS